MKNLEVLEFGVERVPVTFRPTRAISEETERVANEQGMSKNEFIERAVQKELFAHSGVVPRTRRKEWTTEEQGYARKLVGLMRTTGERFANYRTAVLAVLDGAMGAGNPKKLTSTIESEKNT